MLKKLGFYSMSIDLHISPTAEVTGEVNLIDPHSSLDQFKISRFCDSSDGLLLCVCVNKEEENIRLMVWNPCTGQTKLIQSKNSCKQNYNYALGSYQDKKSGNNSYKILSHRYYCPHCIDFKIYEINSSSWRVLDITMDCNLVYLWSMTSLKGKTYWIARDEKEKQLGIFLISFDYPTERFERLCLPYQCPSYWNMSLSVVREEKLSALLKCEHTSKTEIWVTNKIGETKVVSWIKVLALDLKPELSCGQNFLFDDEKKVLVYIQYNGQNIAYKGRYKVYVVGVDNNVRKVDFGAELRPFLFNYVPSLIQIQQGND